MHFHGAVPMGRVLSLELRMSVYEHDLGEIAVIIGQPHLDKEAVGVVAGRQDHLVIKAKVIPPTLASLFSAA
jgi:hypothetical protein